ncbi:hypothetical protein MBRA1_000640 [Malassezia brasiliensis]|uniref:Nucleoporin Nup54 alpha-helical domain-containing protein n=1 Tax=Malassezia brasiliensis TaxID=1821822 RepID=A0AAF0DRC4_9BASI|nr:hypothetical protein MBRA1_000640 [Malassezia brasiliensis]
MAFSFGKAPSTGATPGLFGNPGAGAQGTQGGTQPSQPASSGFSFGTTGSAGLFGQPVSGTQTSQPSSSGGLFGQSTAGTQSAPSGGLFGQNTSTSQPGQSSLFGQNTSASQPGQTGGLFGQKNPVQSQPGQTGGLFGQSSQNQAQGQTGGLFGQSTTQPQGQSGGLFGQSTTQPQGQTGGLFGQSTTQPQGQTGGLFGQSTTQTQGQSGGLFGQSTTQPQGQSGGLFGASQAQSKPALGFGSSQPSSNLFGSQAKPGVSSAQPGAMGMNTSSAAPDAKLGAPLNAQLEQIRASWDTSNLATCRFQHYLYNRASDPQALQQLTVRRPDAVGPMHDALWAKAMQENPEPERLYPVLAVGFSDLRARVQVQETEAVRQHNKLAELAKQLAALQQKHDLSNTIRAQSAMLMQSRIHQRLLSLVKDCATLIPALRNQGMTAVEDQLLVTLETCEAQLNGAAGAADAVPQQALLRAQVNELWAQLGVVRARREALASQGRVDSGNTEWAVVDEASFEELTSILASLQQGLLHLTGILSADTKALNMVCDGLTGVPLVGVRNR